MTYYVQGKTIPDGTSFFDATPYPTVEAAVEGARTKMGLEARRLGSLTMAAI